MSEWRFRLAEPADAEAFAKWSAENQQVEQTDLIAGMKKSNPTVLFFAVEKDGVVQAFAPLYLQMMLAHLGFNPEADNKDKLRAMQMTMSKEEYPVAKWAVKHGFDLESRQAFKLDLNKILALAEV